MNPRVNRWLDLIDRVGWTFLETLPATLAADQVWDGSIPWSVKLGVPATAAFLSAIKVAIGQRTGKDDTGALLPPGAPPVVEPPPVEKP